MTGLNQVSASCFAMGVVLTVAAGCGGKEIFVGDVGVDSTTDPADTGEDVPLILTWARTFAEDLNEGSSIRQTADGGYVVAAVIGYTSDAWVFKLDESGSVVWQKSYGGHGYDGAVSILQTSDAGYVAACDTLSFGAGEADYWILRLDPEGNVVWQKTYGGPGAEYVAAIDETRDGGFVVAGTSNSFDPNSGVWTLKLGADGSVEWESLYSPMATGISIRQTSDGGYVALAETLSYGVGATALLLFKLDAEGAVIWQKLYSASSWQAAGNVLETPDGGYVLTGYAEISEERFSDITVLGLDGSGNILWQEAYGGDEDERWSWMEQTSDGGYVVSGGSSSFRGDGVSHDAWIFKLNADGGIVWQKSYGGDDEDELDIVQQAADGGYVAAGATFTFGPGSPNVWVLKTDPWGDIEGCPSGLVRDTDATVVSPDIYQQDGYLTAVPTTAVVTETAVVPLDTSTSTDRQCGG